jgi:hypothetical protein
MGQAAGVEDFLEVCHTFYRIGCQQESRPLSMIGV